jgi:hypothetical protein
LTRTALALLLVLAAAAPGVSAQGPDFGSATRIGISFGGISTVGVVVELVRDARSIEMALGTWSFRDLALSVIGKQYFGAGAAQPFVGGGLWLVAALPSGERPGVALVARAPIGIDWGVADRHAAALALNVNWAIAVRRTDPEDDMALNRRLVPLPDVSYRWTR